ncbi:hypothetical protein ACJMK2_026699 [Sinanodonta woodiana]|uniref:Uncharacterized protein n=1 Tax=Sinanodonta woodiana TaxID=1069815 RepID=A0ABD3XM92_SINWO
MAILDKGNNKLGTNQAVVIGDELQLIIEGNGGFAFMASSCIATDGYPDYTHSKNLIINGYVSD